MEEKTVVRVMIKYFESKGLKAIRQKGAGVDLHIYGKTEKVEVKGSGLKFDRMLRQLLDYAYKHTNVSLALPFDGLTIKEAHQLRILNYLLIDAKRKGLKVYVIAPHPKRMNNFCVRELRDITEIYYAMGSPTMVKLGYNLNDPDSTIDKAVDNLIKYSPEDCLKDYVCQEFLKREVTTVEI